MYEDIVIPHIIIAVDPDIEYPELRRVVEFDIAVLTNLGSKHMPVYIGKVNEVASEKLFLPDKLRE